MLSISEAGLIINDIAENDGRPQVAMQLGHRLF